MQLVTYVYRGNLLESVHRAEAIVIGPKKVPVFQTENPDTMMFARSSVKPFQAYPMVKSGAVEAYKLSRKEIAICCASHNSEEVHLDVVRQLQQRIGIQEAELACGGHPPIDPETADTLTRANVKFTSNYNNCSGKHTGMLLTSKFLNYPRDGYTDPEHPLQQEISKGLSHFLGRDEIKIGIDGCSAPNFYLSVRELAFLFQQLTAPADPVLAQIYNAMTSEPYMVAGRNRFDTVIMELMKGLAISKTGAEGVRGFGMQINDKAYGVALKVLDGAKRASATMLLTLLEYLGWVSMDKYPELNEYYRPTITNHAGLAVGHIESEIS